MKRLGLVLVAVLAAGPVWAAAAPNRLVALVGGRPITAVELRRRLALRGLDPAGATWADWEAALTASIDRAVLLRAARADKTVEVTEAMVDRALRGQRTGDSQQEERTAVRERLLIRRFLAKRLGPRLTVSPEVVEAWYRENRDLLARREARVARVLTVRPAGGEGAGPARRRLEALRRRLAEGADFAALARKHSVDAWAERGGLLEPVQRGESGSVFADRIFGLKGSGSLSKVFETKQGVHLLRLEKVVPAQTPAFGEVQDAIRERLLRLREEEQVSVLVKRLREGMSIRVFRRHLPRGAGETP
jgi:parvulin-like peptidyl-prolyl isomerase